MKSHLRIRLFLATTLLGLSGAALLQAQQPSGQWDFNAGNLTATVGQPLTYVDGPGGATDLGDAFGTTTALGIPDIGGAPAQVMRFPASTNSGMGYNMPTPATSNGGGTFVNDWTIIMDLLFTGSSHGAWRGLMDTDAGVISADAEFFINAGNQLGIGAYFGAINSNTWHRVGIVVQASTNRIYFYIDGVQVGFRNAADGATAALDGRWTLAVGGAAALFNDNDGEAASGYVNSIQLRDTALTKPQMAALGGPQAAGIPTTLPPIPSFVERWIPAGQFANRTTAVGAVIDSGSTTIQDSSISLALNGAPIASPTITRQGGLITVQHQPAAPLSPGVQYTNTITLTDSLAGQKTFTNKFTAALFFEDFEGVTLTPNKDEGSVSDLAWTHTPPAGWNIDNSQFPAAVISVDNPDGDADGYADGDGITEWAGWSFARKDWWVSVDDQTRSSFTLGQGNVAIADPDEWDDTGHAISLFNSYLKTPPIPLTGISANSAFLTFYSSWRPEGVDDTDANKFPVGPNGEAINNQTAIISVSYNGAAAVQVLKWDSVSTSSTYHPDSQNESVLLQLNNPAGATNMVVTFALLEAANDWWWAIDNVVINAGAAPPIISDQPDRTEIAEGQPVSLTVVSSGSGLNYQWFKGHGGGKTAIAGATSASYALATAKIEDNGYYSVVVSNSVGTATSETVKLTVTPVVGSRLTLLSEDFNGLALGPNVDETVVGANVWTKTPPTGWVIDDTGVPGVGDPDQDGVTEWAGWSFADRAWWAQIGGQNRDQFTKATGAAAIADSDEWDDIGHAAGNMATYLKTKSISLQGVKANSVILKFDSSWNPESPQKANITVAFNGGAPLEVFRYESDQASASFHPVEFNETIALRINNPGTATNMVITYGYFETRNNWWYAIDNILVIGDTAPLFFEDFNSLALGPNVEEGIVTGSGGAKSNVWTKTGPAGWTVDDTGVPGVGTDQDGVTEWAGWSFAERVWWAATTGDQQRTGFTKGTGASAIADSDEWDDIAHAAGNMATYLATPSINITGQAANTLVLRFDSSWRAEDPQKANVRVSYDGGTPVEVLRWESSGANLHPDNVNESVTVALNNPAGATAMRLTFGYFDTRNNWWWAIDNVEVAVSAAPGNIGTLNVAVAGSSLNFTWTGGAAIRLQKTTTLSSPTWTDVAGTTGSSSATEAIGAGNAFYRLFRP